MTITDMQDKKRRLGLYIHIPFCCQKCLYCDFCSVAGAESELVEKYVDSLCRCLEINSKNATGYEVDTIYMGGGTPTVLSSLQLSRVLDSCFSRYSVMPDAEISCECNPATGSYEYFSDIRKMGVNRLSIGLQSMQDRELRALGRIHDSEAFLDTFGIVRSAGFDNISVDLMYGIPEQTMASFEDTLKRVVDIYPEHISAYCLKVEENTPFGKMGEGLILPDDDVTSDMYEMCNSVLGGAGYARYEISNFSKQGRESRHNLRYWLGEEYLGIGAAAHSYFGGERYATSPNITAFANGEFIVNEREKISFKERMTEYVMLRMRLSQGASAKEFKELFERELLCEFPAIERFIESGHIVFAGDSLRFSDKGVFVSSYILSEILDFS